MKVSEQYSYEIKKILNDIDQLKHGKIHELQNATCYPSISRLGEQLEIEINELMNITVQMYPCSEGTDTDSPAL